MSAAAPELAELRERVADLAARVDAYDAAWTALARAGACADIMVRAYEAEGLPVPDGLRSQPRSRSHLRLVREEVPR